jgi:TonB family protein
VRVANVSGVGALVPAIATALRSETDLGAASEMIRFLGALDRPELDKAVLEAARRLGAGVHAPVADAFARRASAASHIPTLRELGLEEPSWLVFYDLATAGAATSPGPLASAILRERDVAGWRALVRALRKADVPLDAGLAVEAVRSEAADIRTATYWRLAETADRSRPPDAAIVSALAATPEARTERPDDPDAALAFELLRRAQGGVARPQVETINAIAATGTNSHAWEGAAQVLELFDKAERKALAKMVFAREDALDDWHATPRPARRAADTSPYVRIQTPAGFPPAFVPDALAAAHCDPSKFGTILGGEVSYRPDGRPLEVGLVQGGKSKECVEATRILLASSLAPVGVPTADRKTLLLLPDEPRFAQCHEEGARRRALQAQRPDRVGTKGKGGRIQEPKKARDRKPEYPESARLRGVQGVVIMEAEIEPSGCVSQVALLRGVDTSLDVEALRAVSGWGYTPTLLNGEAVPVIMTVTVNFKLSR